MTFERVTPGAAYALMRDQGYVYVDVRTELEFSLGHPRGAYNIPWQLEMDGHVLDNEDFTSTVCRHFTLDTKILIGCQSGKRSLNAARRLEAAGFAVLAELRGGYAGIKDPFGRVAEPGWRDEDLPISLDAEPGRSHQALTRE